MEKFKSFFKRKEDEEELQKVIDEAVESESQKLQHGASEEFKENREDQEFNIAANKHFIENILGKKVEIDVLNKEEVKKIEKYIQNKNDGLQARMTAIYEYILENSGTMDPIKYEEVKDKISKIDEKIRELNHKMSKELGQMEYLDKPQAFYYGEQIALYDQQLNQLETDKELLENYIEKNLPKIDAEEEDEWMREHDDLDKKSLKYQNYLHSDPNQN